MLSVLFAKNAGQSRGKGLPGKDVQRCRSWRRPRAVYRPARAAGCVHDELRACHSHSSSPRPVRKSQSQCESSGGDA